MIRDLKNTYLLWCMEVTLMIVCVFLRAVQRVILSWQIQSDKDFVTFLWPKCEPLAIMTWARPPNENQPWRILLWCDPTMHWFPLFSDSSVPITNGRRSDGREQYTVYSCNLLVQKQVTSGDAHVVVECASDLVIPKFTRVTLDNFWRARIDVCMHGLVQP